MASSDHPTLLGMPLPFERAEYERRFATVRRALEDAELDALLVFQQENMNYLFGYDQNGYWVYQVAVVTRERDDIVVLARPADHALIAGLPFVEDLRLWRDDSDDDPARMTADILADVGALGIGRRVGIELHSHALLPHHHGRLRTALDGRVELVDASDLIADLRVRKSDAEVAYCRQAGEILDAGLRAGLEQVRPGATEANVLGAAYAAMFEAGGHMPAVPPPVSSGPRTLSRTHGGATQRVVEDDELFVLEIGACLHRYHVVGVHSRWVGPAPDHVRSTSSELQEALAAGTASVRPGVAAADVARAVNGVLGRQGAFVAGNHVGYGTGIGYPPSWLDTLRIKESSTQVLHPNTVLFLFVHRIVHHRETPLLVFIGEPLLVTGTGSERLSALPLELDVS